MKAQCGSRTPSTDPLSRKSFKKIFQEAYSSADKDMDNDYDFSYSRILKSTALFISNVLLTKILFKKKVLKWGFGVLGRISNHVQVYCK